MNSIWMDTVTLPSFAPLDHDAKTDVLVIGGGLAGILCAYMLAQSGIDYMLIEADKICHGISGNTTAKITSQHGLIYDKLIRTFGIEKARMYLEANEAALGQYKNIAQGIPCDMETKNAYVYSLDQKSELENEVRALDKLGFSAEYTDQLPLPFPVSGAIGFAHQAQFHPLKFVAGIVQGLNIHEHTTARTIDGDVVLTDTAKIKASKVIIATHFPIINKHGFYFMKMYQHRSYVLGLENASNVQGMYVDAKETGLSFRNHKHLLLLGGGAHRTGKQGGNWVELVGFAQRHYPTSQEKYRWAAQDCMTLDDVPYIGQYAKSTPNVYVATGFNKWGITSSMVAATMLHDMVQGHQNAYAPLFSPSRTILRPQLACNLFSSTIGLLSFSKRRCSHMGCALKWNPQEHSWDCPCHGSRFTEKGKLLDNPATQDLS